MAKEQTYVEQRISTPEGMKDYLYGQTKLEMGEMLWTIMEYKKLTTEQVAQKSGYSLSTIDLILNGDTNFKIKTIIDILFSIGYGLHFAACPASIEAKTADIILE